MMIDKFGVGQESDGSMFLETPFYKAKWESSKVGFELIPKPVTPSKVNKRTLDDYKDKPPYDVIVDYETVFIDSYNKSLPRLFDIITEKIVSFGN